VRLDDPFRPASSRDEPAPDPVDGYRIAARQLGTLKIASAFCAAWSSALTDKEHKPRESSSSFLCFRSRSD